LHIAEPANARGRSQAARQSRGIAFIRLSVALGRSGVRAMSRFVSNVTLRLDSKGRVSIPAPFRAILGRDGFEGLYCYPALDRTAIDAGGNALMAEIEALMAGYASFSEAREQFSLALYGTSETLKIDGEGRVVLSEPLKRHASITDQVTFVGLGHKFQIWEPGRFRGELAEATQKVRALKAELGSQAAARNAPGARE
jgi:MraZ protein